ncbi:MAG: VOC family protein [Gammaproteobacteria bacterium]|nr:MAG: VOC family protein [Gammaproteobacteria bacterium]
MRPRITHICLHVDNLEDCVRFYRRYCQMEVIEDLSRGGEGSVYMSEPGRQTDLVFQFMGGGRSHVPAENDERHFGFVVESREAVDVVAKMAREDGVLFFEADEYLPGAYLCTVKDPNGNCVEFSFGHKVPPA